jgi:Protein of unknown function (DUF998)
MPNLLPTRALLICGAVAGPLFVLVVLIQDYTRPGFDPRQHLLSLLSLGDWGWVQIANFVIAGALNLAAAAGLRRSGGTWGPILIAGYGAGLVIVGVFRTPPAFGYPAGAPSGEPLELGLSGTMHKVGFMLVLLSLTAACAVYARRFLASGQPGWGLYSLATGVALPALVVAGTVAGATAGPQPLSLCLRAFALLGWLWAASIAVEALRRPESH